MHSVATLAVFVVIMVVFFFIQVLIMASRYKKCPPDRIMIIYGKTPHREAARCIHGGAAFVWPIFQDYGYISLRPIKLGINPEKIYCRGNEHIDFKISTVIVVSTKPEYMQQAAARLFGQHPDMISELASEMFINSLKSYSKKVTKNDIEADMGSFSDKFRAASEAELKELGLTIKSLSIDVAG